MGFELDSRTGEFTISQGGEKASIRKKDYIKYVRSDNSSNLKIPSMGLDLTFNIYK